MARNAKFREGGDFLSEVDEEGWYEAKLVEIQDYEGPSKYPGTKSVYLRWEIPSMDDQTVRWLIGTTLSPKSKMYSVWQAVQGDELSGDDEVNLDDMIGGHAQLFLENGERKNKETGEVRQFVKVERIRPSKKKHPKREEEEEEEPEDTEEEEEPEEESEEEAEEEEEPEEEEETEVPDCYFCNEPLKTNKDGEPINFRTVRLKGGKEAFFHDSHGRRCYDEWKGKSKEKASKLKKLVKGKKKHKK